MRCSWLLLVVLLLAPLLFAHEQEQESAPSSSTIFGRKQAPFSVPASIHVGLVGLNSDGHRAFHLEASNLRKQLTNSLAVHRPACVAHQAALRVQYNVGYSVEHLLEEHVLALETALSDSLQRAGIADGYVLYDVDVMALEHVFDAMYDAVVDALDGGKDEQPYVVLVLSPNKQRIVPADMDSPGAGKMKLFRYRYRYQGGAHTQAWVARKRYVVVDLSSGPASFGVTMQGEGTVSSADIPSLDFLDDEDVPLGERQAGSAVLNELSAHTRFVAQLVSLVVSSVRHVFLPDTLYGHEDMTFAEKIIVPIIVLRNHNRFNPLMRGGTPDTLEEGQQGPVNEFAMNVDFIRDQISKMMQLKPGEQQLVVVSGVHNLHDHKHVSTALFRSIMGDTVHSATPMGRYVAKTVPYIDSTMLAEELRGAEDLLIASMRSHPHVTRDELLANRVRGQTGRRATGHRVLPVFVFSLLGLPDDLLLDHSFTHVAFPDMVIALQTAADMVFLPYFTEEGVVYTSVRDPTRAVVAGVATALGGLAPPHQRFSHRAGVHVANYMWANGHHPFGPFTGSAELSSVHHDSILRNLVLSQVSNAFDTVQDAMQHLADFGSEYLIDPFGDEIGYEDDGQGPAGVDGGLFGWALQRAAASGTRSSRIASSVLQRCASQVDALVNQIAQLSTLLRDNKLEAALRLSSSLLSRADGFVRYARDEINTARSDLTCCRKTHRLKADWLQDAKWTRMYLTIALLVMGVVIFVLVLRRLGWGRLGVASASSLAGSGWQRRPAARSEDKFAQLTRGSWSDSRY